MPDTIQILSKKAFRFARPDINPSALDALLAQGRFVIGDIVRLHWGDDLFLLYGDNKAAILSPDHDAQDDGIGDVS